MDRGFVIRETTFPNPGSQASNPVILRGSLSNGRWVATSVSVSVSFSTHLFKAERDRRHPQCRIITYNGSFTSELQGIETMLRSAKDLVHDMDPDAISADTNCFCRPELSCI